ncbi:MAG: methionyl-tRNA formyltransferase [Pyramidobacter sp.]|nr:methionyl-tRNA formyltransferase [Pyramidobacter sp.]
MTSDIWFFGTGKFAARCLAEIAPECRPSLVVTSQPTVSGRGLKTKPSPVEEAAAALGLPLYRSDSVNGDAELVARLEKETPALILVVDFGQKVKDPYLTAPRCGCINIHPSLLPRYRGAAPVQRALMNGELSTGVSLFRLVEKMDAGPIWIQSESGVGADETAGELLERLAVEGSHIFKSRLKYILEGNVVFEPQRDDEATIAPKIDKSETRLLDFSSAQSLHNKVRALSPLPGAYVMLHQKRVKILKTALSSQPSNGAGVISCSGKTVLLGAEDGSIELKSVQPEGKKEMNAFDWFKGLRLEKGEKLDD